MNSDRELAATYGPPAAYSEYKRGQRLTYQPAGCPVRSGEILWVAAADQVGATALPLRYIVASDQEHGDQALSGLDIVWPHEIVEDITNATA